MDQTQTYFALAAVAIAAYFAYCYFNHIQPDPKVINDILNS